MTKKITAVEFNIKINTKTYEDMGNFMKDLDLGIERIDNIEAYSMKWTTTTKVDDKYVRKVKKVIDDSMTKQGHRLVSCNLITEIK